MVSDCGDEDAGPGLILGLTQDLFALLFNAEGYTIDLGLSLL